MRKERICIACGSKYEYCPVCNPQDKSKPAWMYAYDKESCMKLWKIMSAFSSGYATKEDVRRVVNRYNIIPSKLTPNVGKHLKEILNSSDPSIKINDEKISNDEPSNTKIKKSKKIKDNEQLIDEA